MRNKREFIRIILNLFDGSDAGAAGSEGAGSSTGAGTIDPDVQARGRELGLDDDLMEDYQKAFHSGKGTDTGESETTNQNENNEEAGENLEAEFDELVRGKYKDVYKQRTSAFVQDRLSRANRGKAELEARAAKSDKLMSLLAEKYGESDPDKLYDAVRGDDELWRQQAIDKGQTREEFLQQYDTKMSQQEQQRELEELRQYKKTNELDRRLRGLAAQTREQYPDFNLEAEFDNPKFRAALDFVAAQNEQSGKGGEVFDLTYAYELAHADELRNNQIKRVSKATEYAVAQTIAANRQRPAENAGRHTPPTKAKSVSSLSDAEFDALLDKVRRGEAHIPR